MPHKQVRRQREEAGSMTTFVNESSEQPLKVTYRSINKLHNLNPQDGVNLTSTNRSLDKYAKRLGFESVDNLINLILMRYENTGRKVRVLDAGCGEGCAIDMLLSEPRLKEALGTCVGISIHYFANIRNLLLKHKNRFVYFSGKVQDVLQTMPNEFDFVFDLYGAYYYSKDSVNLLSSFYDALAPGGVAKIMPIFEGRQVRLPQTRAQDFVSYVTENFPAVFSECETSSSLVIKKTSQRFPLPRFNCQLQEIKSSVGGRLTKRKLAGNAVRPAVTFFKLVNQQPMRLRELPYSDKEMLLGAEKQNTLTFS